ncbi:hypothetical protein [Leptolyngbya sp. PCC 6406]|uniref:hypothetical protein n=1 Tax=Leptolyngbya sp. PCC 6406 TaxID=1173264 RepID=UPI00047F6FDD|nr:hypothetical protein [Leptolyngbya sp. PCC 6406]
MSTPDQEVPKTIAVTLLLNKGFKIDAIVVLKFVNEQLNYNPGAMLFREIPSDHLLNMVQELL